MHAALHKKLAWIFPQTILDAPAILTGWIIHPVRNFPPSGWFLNPCSLNLSSILTEFPSHPVRIFFQCSPNFHAKQADFSFLSYALPIAHCAYANTGRFFPAHIALCTLHLARELYRKKTPVRKEDCGEMALLRRAARVQCTFLSCCPHLIAQARVLRYILYCVIL